MNDRELVEALMAYINRICDRPMVEKLKSKDRTIIAELNSDGSVHDFVDYSKNANPEDIICWLAAVIADLGV